jgi:hypothetical protein
MVWRLALAALAGLVIFLGGGQLRTGPIAAQVDGVSPPTASSAYVYDVADQASLAHALIVSPRHFRTLNEAVTGLAAGRIDTSAATGVAAETAGNAGDHIVLGLRANGLEATAAKVGGRTLLKDPEWMTTLQRGIADSSTKFTVSLDGMSGSSTYAQVMSAAGRGAAGTGGYTDWEMAQLYQGGRLSDTTFMRGGSVVDNPFG